MKWDGCLFSFLHIQGSLKDRQCVLKLLRLWRERSVFDHHVLDPIDAFVDVVERKGSSGRSRGGGGPPPSDSRSRSNIGDKRCVCLFIINYILLGISERPLLLQLSYGMLFVFIRWLTFSPLFLCCHHDALLDVYV